MTVADNLKARARQSVARRDNTTPAQNEDRPRTLYATLKELQPQLDRALPRHLTSDRIARLALTAVRKSHELSLCTSDSFAGALLTTAALGLEPGMNGESYLVPYRDHGVWQCQLIVGYQGYAKLFYQSSIGSHLAAHPVYEADTFDYEYGTGQFLRHKPSRLPVEDRGELIYYYATARLTTGSTHFEVLTPEEVRTLRRGKVGPKGDIPDPQRWMERKTVVRQVVKLLPKSPMLLQAAQVDERSGAELFRDRLAEKQAEDDVLDIPPGDINDGTEPNGDTEQ